MKTKIDWHRYFDKIICVHYLPYNDRLEIVIETTLNHMNEFYLQDFDVLNKSVNFKMVLIMLY